MAKKLDHKCIICGELYHSCDTCEKIKTYTPWRTVCDSFEHYQIYLAIRTYQENLDSKENIQAELHRLGVRKGSYAKWPEGTKKLLDEILEPVKKTKKVALNPVVVKDESVNDTENVSE